MTMVPGEHGAFLPPISRFMRDTPLSANKYRNESCPIVLLINMPLLER